MPNHRKAAVACRRSESFCFCFDSKRASITCFCCCCCCVWMKARSSSISCRSAVTSVAASNGSSGLSRTEVGLPLDEREEVGSSGCSHREFAFPPPLPWADSIMQEPGGAVGLAGSLVLPPETPSGVSASSSAGGGADDGGSKGIGTEYVGTEYVSTSSKPHQLFSHWNRRSIVNGAERRPEGMSRGLVMLRGKRAKSSGEPSAAHRPRYR